jgi:hypothetical protein
MHESDAFFDFDDGSTQNGRRESPRQATLSVLASDLNGKLKLGGDPSPAATQPINHPHVLDPAIMNVMRFPPIPPFLPPGVPPTQFSVPLFPAGLNDPAIMSMRQMPPQNLLLLQQKQQHFFHQPPMKQPPPQQQQPPPPVHSGFNIIKHFSLCHYQCSKTNEIQKRAIVFRRSGAYLQRSSRVIL